MASRVAAKGGLRRQFTQAFTLTLVLALLSSIALGWKLRRRWVETPWDAGSAASTNEKLRSHLPRQEYRGVLQHFLRLRGKSGREVALHVVDAEFSAKAISPWEKSQPWKNALLVNSVDERESAAGGLSGGIVPGCAAMQTNSRLLSGEVRIRDCVGAYRNHGVRWVANVVVVPWEAFNDQALCVDLSRKGDPEKRAECLRGVIDKGFTALFNELRDKEKPYRDAVDAIVIPALGTGNGALAKSDFYEVLAGHLRQELDRADDTMALPPDIFLQVRGLEPALTDHVMQWAIPSALGGLADTWKGAQGSPDVSLFGSNAAAWSCLSMLLLAWRMSPRRPRWFVRFLSRFNHKHVPLVALGWGLAALGTATALGSLPAAFDLSMPWWGHLVSGVIAVFMSGALLAAGDAFEDSGAS